ncbi:MAG: restriction endonuclease subunit S [ANME-2 cluster archaeon]|nr:restriction endonuclease subunit S [ANME-2 cluster archaeon]MBC2706177.1 restriction endonuclease subunit S [ANME-2 cluster archaeon]MBC2747008.1 restriction endonuclease subunit S [ANME-2 cluster archaeon]
MDDVCFVEYGTRVVQKRDGGTIYPVYGGGGATFFMDESNREDCLIISRFAMSEKCTRFVKGKFFLNDSGLSIIPKNENELCQEFLNYQILSLNDCIYSLARGTAQKNLDVPKFRKMDIHFPNSINEQKRIVAILDEAFESIAKAKESAEKNLKNATEVFESYLQSVFKNKGDGWEEKKLEEISKIFGRGKSKHRPRNDKKLYGGKYPFIQTGKIRNCKHFITEYTQTYNEIGLTQSKLWPKGTICITIAANIAETGILTFDACFPDSVIGVVVDEKSADSGFVEYLLQSFKIKLQALGKGSAQANINLGTFENERFPFPKSISEQQSIVVKLDTLSAETKRLEAVYEKKLADLEELKKSILQKAFNGELTEASV